jgi:hypothetical protein
MVDRTAQWLGRDEQLLAVSASGTPTMLMWGTDDLRVDLTV